MTEVEVLVVGGGPVGSAVALELQRRGREVLLVDAGAAAHKICGEGILPLGWSILQELGVANKIERLAPITELVYQLPEASRDSLPRLRAELSLPSHGVERAELMKAFSLCLREARVERWEATRFRGLEVEPRGVRVRLEGQRAGELRCRLLIGADGLHSRVRGQAGLHCARPRRFFRWGTRVYFRENSCRAGVTVTLGEGVETYLTPLGDGLHGLAFLWSPALLGRPPEGEGPLWSRLLERFPQAYRRTLPPLEAFWGADRAIGPLQQRVCSPLHPSGRIALLGDAGGYLDALTGEGLCLGLAQAMSLAELYQSGRIINYPWRHRLLKLRHILVVSALLRLLERPPLKRAVFSTLLRFPGLFQRLLTAVVEGGARRV